MSIKLIDEWRSAWKYLSVHANLIGLSVSGAYMNYYDKLKDTFPAEWMAGLTAAIFLIGIIVRVVDQNSGKKE